MGSLGVYTLETLLCWNPNILWFCLGGFLFFLIFFFFIVRQVMLFICPAEEKHEVSARCNWEETFRSWKANKVSKKRTKTKIIGASPPSLNHLENLKQGQNVSELSWAIQIQLLRGIAKFPFNLRTITSHKTIRQMAFYFLLP